MNCFHGIPPVPVLMDWVLPGSTHEPRAWLPGKEGRQKRALEGGVISMGGELRSPLRNPPPSPLLPLPTGEEVPTLAKRSEAAGRGAPWPAARWRWQPA